VLFWGACTRTTYYAALVYIWCMSGRLWGLRSSRPSCFASLSRLWRSGMAVLAGLFCLGIRSLLPRDRSRLPVSAGLFCHGTRPLLPRDRSLLTLMHTSASYSSMDNPLIGTNSVMRTLLDRIDVAVNIVFTLEFAIKASPFAFCRILGLFCRILGLFCRILGLFCRRLRLFVFFP